MKKLIFLLLILTSCGYAIIDNSNPVIIAKIENYDEGYCDYYGKGNYNAMLTATSPYFKFRDKCDKFRVGDTVYINSKKE